MAKMNDLDLSVILAQEINTALGVSGGRLSEERRQLLAAYQGLPQGDEVEGQSQVRTRQIYEVIEWTKPAILRLFLASDTIVEFSPYRPGGEAEADQATAYVNYILTRDNNAFQIFNCWLTDALISKVGYVKVSWVDTKTSSISTYQGLSDQEYQAVTQGDDVEILEEAAYPNPDPQMWWFNEDNPNPQAPQLHDVKIRVWTTEGRVKIENIAPEEVLVSHRAPDILLDGKHFCGIRSQKTVSDLRSLGYDEDLIQQCIGSDPQEYNLERITRFQEDDFPSTDSRDDEPARTIWLEESWLPVDMDGDGIAELTHVVSGNNGQVIFEHDLADNVPIIAFTAIPMPHKHIGMSLAETVLDIQQIGTALTRQVLNNLYLTNNPRFLVDEMALTDESIDDFLNPRSGGLVRVANVQGIVPIEVPFVAQASLPILQYLEHEMSGRTGIDRHNQGISPDDLQRPTASGISLLQQAAAQRVELMGRLFAESIRVLGERILGLVIKHQSEARIIHLTGKFIPMDVKSWNASMDISCAAGLGTGNRDNQLQHLMSILQIQQQVVATQGGVQGPLVQVQDIYAVLNKITEASGFKTPFFTDPSSMPPQQPGQQKPDPAMMKAQAEAQATQVKTQAGIQADQAHAQASMAIEQQKAQHQMQIEAMKAQHQMELLHAREQAKAEIAILTAQNKANMEESAPIQTGNRMTMI